MTKEKEMNQEVKKFFEDHPESTILGDGELVHIEQFPSLGEVLRRSAPWEKVYRAMNDFPAMQEILVDNVKERLNSVAAETVHKLAKTGMSYLEISVDTGLTEDYVIQTMEALGIEASRIEENDHGQG
jgi:hypothetical protein